MSSVDPIISRIQAFNKMYGLPCNDKPTLHFPDRGALIRRLEQFKKIMLEEIAEVDLIIDKAPTAVRPDDLDVLTDLADWLGDLQVYAMSEMRKFGIDNDAVLHIIMDSNFSKLGADGKAIMKDGKVQKGPNYWKPEPMLRRHLEAAQLGHFGVDEANKVVLGAPSANATQIGGSHYKTKHGLEHWDMVSMFNLDYFQGQVSRYLFRWKNKNGLEDLRKARHFLDKYIELEVAKGASVGNTPVAGVVNDFKRIFPGASVNTEAMELKPWDVKADPHVQDSTPFWQNEGYYGDGTCLYSCRSCKATTRRTQAPALPHQCPAKMAPEGSEQPA